MSSSSNNIDIDGNLELRKLRSISPSQFVEIVRLLDENDYWKVLMGTVPKLLPNEENLHLPIDTKCEKRYNSAEVELVANASKKDGRTAAHIFLFEWSTTGRRRPTLDHLVILLKAANLYGPANYVATKILQKVAVEKPTTGPGKSWSKELDEMEAALAEKDENVTIENNLDNSKPMNTLCAANAPKLLVPAGRSRQGSVCNKTGCDKSTQRIDGAANVPALEITAATASVQLETAVKTRSECKVDNIVLQSPPDSETEASGSGPRPNFSGLMQIVDLEANPPSCETTASMNSTSSTTSYDSSRSLHSQATQSTQLSTDLQDNIPHFSDLLNISRNVSLEQKQVQSKSQNTGVVSDFENRPQLSALLDGAVATLIGSNQSESFIMSTESSTENHPDLSGLLGKSTIPTDLPTNLPNVSLLMHSNGDQPSNMPDFSNLIGNNQSSQHLPAFSALLPNLTSGKESDYNDDSSSDDD